MELKFGQKLVQEWGLREEKLRQVTSPRVRSWEARAEIPFLPHPTLPSPQIPPLLLTGGREGLASSLPFPRGKGPGEKGGGLILEGPERESTMGLTSPIREVGEAASAGVQS